MLLPVTPWFTPPYAVLRRAKNLYTLKPKVYIFLARCTTPYGGVNHGVTILSPTNHTFIGLITHYWTKIIFKHVLGQFGVQ